MLAGHRGVEWSWCGVSPGRFYHWLYGNLLRKYNCKSEILCPRFSDILFALIGLAFAAFTCLPPLQERVSRVSHQAQRR